jgi:hypothetical protein
MDTSISDTQAAHNMQAWAGTHVLPVFQSVVVGNVLDVAGQVRGLSACTLHVLLKRLSSPPDPSSSSMWSEGDRVDGDSAHSAMPYLCTG